MDITRIVSIACTCVVLACSSSDQSLSSESGTYSQKHRAQFHFSPLAGWMNDPNGLVYYEGEYHMFFQYYPDSTVWGPMHWGHAVSKDMIHWEELPVALYPDSSGYIFSGSAVVDWKNSSGLGDGVTPPLVAIYTSHIPDERVDRESQFIAYSRNKGRTWTKYDKNPVLANPGISDFRDPKVGWSDQYDKWLMSLAVQDHIEFYESSNLIEWHKLSEFGKSMGNHGGVWECPDLFALRDSANNMKWVLLVSINPGGPLGGSATQYFIGDFDGTSFHPQDSAVRWVDYGPDNYAGVTWSDVPERDGRRLFIGWMSNWLYGNLTPTSTWRSAMTLPRFIELYLHNDKYQLRFSPIDEVKQLDEETFRLNGNGIVMDSLFRIEINGLDSLGTEGMKLVLSNAKAENVSIELMNNSLTVDRTNSGQVDFSKSFGAVHSVELNTIIPDRMVVFVDVSSIEIFINDGELVFTEIVFPNTPWNTISLMKPYPIFTVTTLKSIR